MASSQCSSKERGSWPSHSYVFAQDGLRGAEVPLEAVETLLVLIPKEDKLASIKGVRPIFFYNVCVKVVMKMIMNHLKEILEDIISPNQASLVPGRQTIDNIAICQEIVHTLKYTKAKRGGMVLKIDLEKAYDRLEWYFIEEMLRDAMIPTYLIVVVLAISFGTENWQIESDPPEGSGKVICYLHTSLCCVWRD